MKILIVSKCPTHPTTAGNRNSILAQVEFFKQQSCDVHFLYIEDKFWRKKNFIFEDTINLSKKYWGANFHVFKINYLLKIKFTFIKYYRHLFFKNHYRVDDLYPSGIENVVNRLNDMYSFDICIVNYFYLSNLFNYISIPKKAIMTHDTFAYKNLKVGRNILCITSDTEAKAMQRCPHIFAVQNNEYGYFKTISPLSQVYNIYAKYEYHHQPIIGNKSIVFLSGNNLYNQNGIKWFISEIFSKICKIFPDVNLLIGGSICKTMYSLSLDSKIHLVGLVDNLENFYALGDVAINPTYQGTGLKIKTFESISYDKVTLVHPHSLEGVFDEKTAPLFSSDNPDEWVDFLKKLWITDEILISDIKKSNKDYMKKMNNFISSEYERFIKD